VKRQLPALALALTALAGCGSNDAAPIENDSDTRAVALECITGEKKIDARLEGENWIILGRGADPPRIKFFLTSGEAEARQFEGKAEGAEQIGVALLYVRHGADDMLAEVEDCLSEL
jgi:hypothetical protein